LFLVSRNLKNKRIRWLERSLVVGTICTGHLGDSLVSGTIKSRSRRYWRYYCDDL
jgi:hypothetical protein